MFLAMAATSQAVTVDTCAAAELVGLNLERSQLDLIVEKVKRQTAVSEPTLGSASAVEHDRRPDAPAPGEQAEQTANKAELTLAPTTTKEATPTEGTPETETPRAVAAADPPQPQEQKPMPGGDPEGDQSDATARASSPTPINLSAITSETSGSGSSSGSGSTIRQTTFVARRKSLDCDDDDDDGGSGGGPPPLPALPPLGGHSSSQHYQAPIAPMGRTSRKSSPRQRIVPDALSYLEPDSPAVTPEAIRRSIEVASRRRTSGAPHHHHHHHHHNSSGGGSSGSHRMSPSARSSTSSGSSSRQSDTFSMSGDLGTDRSSSPEQSVVDGDDGSVTGASSAASTVTTTQAAAPPPGTGAVTLLLPAPTGGNGEKRRSRGGKSYGTPEMPRGNANLPHIPPNALQPRLPQYQGHIKHLPRAEKLPLSGYELIAAKLSPGESGLPTIQPMYRRFESMNHRVLLNLQDELAELEQQLSHLDTLDTQTRRSLNGIIPASRRKEYLAPSELQWQKTDILGKIGYKLSQYNHALSTFRETQNLPGPMLSDVSDYRSYLATHNPITEIETRFLDVVDDLVSVGRPLSPGSDETDSVSEEGAPTPIQQYPAATSTNAATAATASTTTTNGSSVNGGDSKSTLPTDPSDHDKDRLVSRIKGAAGGGTSIPLAPAHRASVAAPSYEPTITHVALAVAVSFLLPILTFSVIPSFLGRMIVVFLVAVGVLSPLMQSRERLGVDARDGVVLASIYGGAMAVVATIFT